MSTTLTIRERVNAGVEKLDSIDSHWANEIDLELLDIGISESCVLGQLYGDYQSGMHVLSAYTGELDDDNPFDADECEHLTCVNSTYAESLGFEVCHDLSGDTDIVNEVSELTDAWAEVIRERQGVTV